MKIVYKIATIIIVSLITISLNAQDESSHEIGLISGSASFTTDYGERNHLKSNVAGNVGPGFGAVYYLNFTDYRYRWNQRTNYWAEHFRVRAELSYMSAKLDHFGQWAEDLSTDGGVLLRAHHGKTYLLNMVSLIKKIQFGKTKCPQTRLCFKNGQCDGSSEVEYFLPWLWPTIAPSDRAWYRTAAGPSR